MSNEVAFNSLEKDDVKISFEEPSRIRAKPTDEEVARHRKTRLVLVVLFGIIVLTMVVVAVIIIIVSPRCEPKKVPEESGKSNVNDTDTADDSWWKHAVIYQVYPRSFFDANNDGDGDLKGITEKLGHFGELGVDALWLNPIYASPMADNGYDVKNYEKIDERFGTMDDFEKFLKESHSKGLKVIMDFVPNHTSEQHPWFVESKKDKTNPKSDWYIWANGKGENKTEPPNNWISFFGGSAWEYDDERKQFYLHQFKKEQPDLNLTKEEVKEELKKVLQFWIDKGVDGFRVDAVLFFLEDDKLENEPENPNYNASNLKYDMLKHTLTHDLDGDLDILKEFQGVVNNGSKRLLIAEVDGEYSRTSRYYAVADIPKNFGLISKVKRPGMTLAQGIKNTVEEYLAAVPKGKTPNWVIGNHDNDRVGSRVGAGNRDAMNVLLLTLPGVVTTYYGEEIGMLNGNITNPSDYRDDERTPMQWSAETNAGFSTAKKTWLPVADDYKTYNVENEKKDSKSFYSNYKKLVTLRKMPAFASGDFKVVHIDEHVLSYTRSLGNEKYLVVINFSDKMWDKDIKDLSGRGVMVFDSEGDKLSMDEVDVNKIAVNPGQAVIVNGTSQEWYYS